MVPLEDFVMVLGIDFSGAPEEDSGSSSAFTCDVGRGASLIPSMWIVENLGLSARGGWAICY